MPPVPSNRHTLHSASMASHHHDFVPITVGCPSGLGPGEPGDEVSEMTRSLQRRPSVDSLDSAFMSLSVATPRVAAVSHPLMAPGDDDEAPPPSRGGRNDNGLGGLGGHESFDDDVSDDPYGLDGGGEGEASIPSLFEDRLRPSKGAANAAKAAAAERNAAAQIMRASHVASSRQGGGGGGAPSPPSNLLRGVSGGGGKARGGGRRSSLSARAFRVHARRASSMDHLSPSDPPTLARSTPSAAASGYGWFGGRGRGGGGAASTDAFRGGDGLEGDDGETMRGVLAELKVLLAEAQTEAESHRNLARKLLEENLSLKEQMNRREEEGCDDGGGDGIGDRNGGHDGNGRGNGNAASDLRDREREAEITRLRSEAKQLRKNEMDALAKINRLLREREKLRSENLTLAEKNVKESVERSAEYREKTAGLERERDELRAECERLKEEREEAVLERNELRSRTGRMSVMIPRKEAEREEVCPSLAAIGAAAAESNGGGGGRASLNLGSLVSKFQSSRNVMGEIGGGGGRGGGGGVGKLGLGGGGRGMGGGGYPSKPRGPLSRQKSKTEVSPEDLLWDSYEGVGGGGDDDNDSDGEDLNHGGAGAVDNGVHHRGAHHGRNDWGMGAIREDRL